MHFYLTPEMDCPVTNVWILVVATGVGLLWGIMSNPAFAQSDDFRFTVKRTEEGIALRGEEGCLWKTLTWTCPKSKECEWGINPKGMFFPSSDPSGEGFWIIVEATDDGGVLTCKQGCAWKELTWTCEGDPCEAKVDFNGITTRP